MPSIQFIVCCWFSINIFAHFFCSCSASGLVIGVVVVVLIVLTVVVMVVGMFSYVVCYTEAIETLVDIIY